MSEMTYTKKLSGILASFAVIVMLGANIFSTMTIDFNTMMFALTKVLPVSFGFWYLGYLIGRILDNPRKKKLIKK